MSYRSNDSTPAAAGCIILTFFAAVILTIIYGEACWTSDVLATIWNKHPDFWKILLTTTLGTIILPGVQLTGLFFAQIYIWFIM